MVQNGLGVIEIAIKRITERVLYLKKSSSRLHKFGKITRQLGICTTRGLCYDVPTRWNSTYDMLDVAFTYRSVFINTVKLMQIIMASLSS